MVAWVDSVIEFLFAGSALATLILTFAIARQMSTGIFRRFFMFLKLAAIVGLINRIYLFLVAFDLMPTYVLNPQSAGRVGASIFSFLLLLSLIFLYVDWRMTSLDQPIKPR